MNGAGINRVGVNGSALPNWVVRAVVLAVAAATVNAEPTRTTFGSAVGDCAATVSIVAAQTVQAYATSSAESTANATGTVTFSGECDVTAGAVGTAAVIRLVYADATADATATGAAIPASALGYADAVAGASCVDAIAHIVHPGASNVGCGAVSLDSSGDVTRYSWVGTTAGVEYTRAEASVQRNGDAFYRHDGYVLGAVGTGAGEVDPDRVLVSVTLGAFDFATGTGSVIGAIRYSAASYGVGSSYGIDYAATAGDLYFDKVALLAHFDGANNGTTFIDSSKHNWPLTPLGSCKTSTAQSKFGTAAGYFDGLGGNVSFSDSGALTIGTNDFTIEAWVYLTGMAEPDASGNRTAMILSGEDASTRYCSLEIGGTSQNTGSSIAFYGGGVTAPVAVTVTHNAWHHIAAAREGNSLRFFCDGQIYGSLYFNQSVQSAGQWHIGGSEVRGSYFPGYIDDLRVTNGLARYKANFTVPAEAFPDFIAGVSGNRILSGRSTSSALASSQAAGVRVAMGSTSLVPVMKPAGDTWTNLAGVSTLAQDVCTSADGQTVVYVTGVNRVYVSTNGGATFTLHTIQGATALYFSSVSDNGQVIVVSGAYGQLFVSTNGGGFVERTPVYIQYAGFACVSGDGSTIYLADKYQGIYKSTNNGVSFTYINGAQNWDGIACSQNGSIVAAISGQTVSVSQNGGATWMTYDPGGGYIHEFDMTPDGQTIVVIQYYDNSARISRNAGVTWTRLELPSSPYCVAVSDSGTNVVIGTTNGFLISNDGLQTAHSALVQSTTYFPLRVACSADFNTLYSVSQNVSDSRRIYKSVAAPGGGEAIATAISYPVNAARRLVATATANAQADITADALATRYAVAYATATADGIPAQYATQHTGQAMGAGGSEGSVSSNMGYAAFGYAVADSTGSGFCAINYAASASAVASATGISAAASTNSEKAAPDDRFMIVPFEDRAMPVYAEDRTMRVEA